MAALQQNGLATKWRIGRTVFLPGTNGAPRTALFNLLNAAQNFPRRRAVAIGAPDVANGAKLSFKG
eukprot:scaffold731_cov261-Pinguiococcus_pyrenoidosus.AAC.117